MRSLTNLCRRFVVKMLYKALDTRYARERVNQPGVAALFVAVSRESGK